MKFLHSSLSGHHQLQRGVTLIEALAALVIMSFGMVALVGLQGNLRRSGDLAKQRSEAMRIAQTELATLRSFSVLDKPEGAPANIRDYDNDLVTAASHAVPADNTNTTFVLTRTVTPVVKDSAEPQAKSVRVTVRWRDRSDADQSLFLDTVISRTDPVYAMALGITPPTNGIRQTDGRNPVIPPTAKDLGNGSSAFRPGANATAVWIFNNVTGVIVGKCEIPVATAVSSLTPSSVESCNNNTVGYLVSGTIRFSGLFTPDPSNPEADALPQPLAAYVKLTPSQFRNSAGTALLEGGDYPLPNPDCFTDAPASAAVTPPQKLVNYYCTVYPNTQSPRNWWGQVLLTGLDLGTNATQYKVCRYSGDYNGNGYTYTIPDAKKPYLFKIDNEEHPETYRGVSYSLARQNFLVMPGKATATCPLLPADMDMGRFVDNSTYQIQP